MSDLRKYVELVRHVSSRFHRSSGSVGLEVSRESNVVELKDCRNGLGEILLELATCPRIRRLLPLMSV